MQSRSGLVALVALVALATMMAAGCKDEKKTDVNTATGGGDGSVATDGAGGSDAASATDATDPASPAADAGADAGGHSGHGDGGKKAAHADGGSSLETAGETDGGHPRARVVNVDEGSAGTTIELAPGQALVVSLVATPSTGFDWDVVKSPPALSGPEMGFVKGGEQPGAPGKRRLTFVVKTALPAGEHELVLGYARSFEKGVAPFKTFKLKLRAPR